MFVLFVVEYTWIVEVKARKKVDIERIRCCVSASALSKQQRTIGTKKVSKSGEKDF